MKTPFNTRPYFEAKAIINGRKEVVAVSPFREEDVFVPKSIKSKYEYFFFNIPERTLDEWCVTGEEVHSEPHISFESYIEVTPDDIDSGLDNFRQD